MKSNFVLFRLADDEAIYVADLQAGTVERREPDDMSGMDLPEATGKRQEPTVKGVDFAVASSVRPTAASHVLFPNR